MCTAAARWPRNWSGRVRARLTAIRLALGCLWRGHDDVIERDEGAMALVCLECGRRTQGWNWPVSAPLRRTYPDGWPQTAHWLLEDKRSINWK
jgi:hypothetical protein